MNSNHMDTSNPQTGQILYKGHYYFDFAFPVPEHLPPTLHARRGRTVYLLSVRLRHCHEGLGDFTDIKEIRVRKCVPLRQTGFSALFEGPTGEGEFKSGLRVQNVIACCDDDWSEHEDQPMSPTSPTTSKGCFWLQNLNEDVKNIRNVECKLIETQSYRTPFSDDNNTAWSERLVIGKPVRYTLSSDHNQRTNLFSPENPMIFPVSVEGAMPDSKTINMEVFHHFEVTVQYEPKSRESCCNPSRGRRQLFKRMRRDEERPVPTRLSIAEEEACLPNRRPDRRRRWTMDGANHASKLHNLAFGSLGRQFARKAQPCTISADIAPSYEEVEDQSASGARLGVGHTCNWESRDASRRSSLSSPTSVAASCSLPSPTSSSTSSSTSYPSLSLPSPSSTSSSSLPPTSPHPTLTALPSTTNPKESPCPCTHRNPISRRFHRLHRLTKFLSPRTRKLTLAVPVRILHVSDEAWDTRGRGSAPEPFQFDYDQYDLNAYADAADDDDGVDAYGLDAELNIMGGGNGNGNGSLPNTPHHYFSVPGINNMNAEDLGGERSPVRASPRGGNSNVDLGFWGNDRVDRVAGVQERHTSVHPILLDSRIWDLFGIAPW
ncbi:hypothetical protein HK102_003392 [Quaeritorhiza haematococci]|nr:hypothetical protein HK102_003392 [Quaeritorhiza haematococci]